ncbi:MAG: restriction endonuclease subunit S [Enterococcus viikkiensis]|uniref:restriction endonuclease subunit S n=1 Tax=Lactococcus lactis subsp. cremoris TaxID=1359 RepID=UPI000423ED35|nr:MULTISPECIES: restriction endonuclease subunit S [Lactococcus]AXN65374.1 type I restriction endonuclease subunit [Lactococcus cremoris]KZK40749.1 Restriction endonuclease S subunit [Lactococcus cremoris]OAJ98031.1 restriction endonuclease subunit S [Lactococcus lactis]QTB94332.1 restriction endonuclease subunit S [Lactococcus cremoris]QTB96564.1 restriction endonuclease subunit S [Lactococcus cremoris]
MEIKKLNALVTFMPGINQSRADKQFKVNDFNYYTQASFEDDFNHVDSFSRPKTETMASKNFVTEQEDIVINNSLQMAAKVGKENKGKVLSINFTKVEFKNDQLDKNYFLYLFNVFKDVKRQKEKEMQGTGVIQKIPLKALGNIKIPLLPIVEQQKIGNIYIETLRLQSELSQFSRTLEEFSYSLLEGAIKDGNKNEK